mmetsp:Transcript_1942/g.4184  ORF Transcript_1942/g.4184 Transcript_1942/m.4184 type:complete len:146 (+) Transcript_1942:307-744(+)
MDVNLSEESIREAPNGDAYSPGSGGWPTIRYFNKETGISGGAYEKKTDKSMCDELGDDSMMEAYVEDYGDVSTCSVISGEGCDERETGFIAKAKVMSLEDQKAYVVRLDGMEGQSMKPELLMWLKKRRKVLKQLVAAAADGNDEL